MQCIIVNQARLVVYRVPQMAQSLIISPEHVYARKIFRFEQVMYWDYLHETGGRINLRTLNSDWPWPNDYRQRCRKRRTKPRKKVWRTGRRWGGYGKAVYQVPLKSAPCEAKIGVDSKAVQVCLDISPNFIKNNHLISPVIGREKQMFAHDDMCISQSDDIVGAIYVNREQWLGRRLISTTETEKQIMVFEDHVEIVSARADETVLKYQPLQVIETTKSKLRSRSKMFLFQRC